MNPGKNPGYLLFLVPLACLPDGQGLGGRALPAPDAEVQADAGADQREAAPDVQPDVAPMPDARPDMPPDAPWSYTKRDGESCGASEECRSKNCQGGICARKGNGGACVSDETCESNYCDLSGICAWPPCHSACLAHPASGGPECVSTCGPGLLCCQSMCRTPVDGGLPDGGGCV